jgi:hypothetical protein
MAPEQLAAKPIDVRTDIYAAGLVAYEVLTGTPARPLGKVGIVELIKARSLLPRVPSEAFEGLTEELDTVLLRSLAPDPDARFATASEFHAALLSALAISPDADLLGEMASSVQTSVLAASATLGVSVSGSDSIDGMVSTVAEVSSPSGRSMILLMLLIIAIAGIAIWTVLNQPGEQTRLAYLGTARAPASGRETSVASQDVVGRSDAVNESSDASGVTPEVVARDEGRPDQGVAPPKGKGRRPAPLRGSPRYDSAPREQIVALQFKTSGPSPLYVSGNLIQDGFAPRITSKLPEGAHVFRLRGAEGRQAIVRITRAGESISARLGAPQGQYFSVQCNGRDRGHTPVMSIPLLGTLKCTLRDASGGQLGFTIEKAPQ